MDVTNIVKEYVNKNAICMSIGEASLIAETILSRKNSDLLIFGVGNDSSLWIDLNDGETAFIEDSYEWITTVKKKTPDINVFHIDYPRRIEEWEYLLEHTEELKIPIPQLISCKKWDIIFVDAPLGNYKKNNKNVPGRMYSIYMASKLIADDGIILVHDCSRKIENAYSNKFIGKKYLENEIVKGSYKGGVLRKYVIKKESAQ